MRKADAHRAERGVGAARRGADALSADEVEQLGAQGLNSGVADERAALAGRAIRPGGVGGELVERAHQGVESRDETLHRGHEGAGIVRHGEGGRAAGFEQVQAHPRNRPADRVGGAGHRQPVDAHRGVAGRLALRHAARGAGAVAQTAQRTRSAAGAHGEGVGRAGVIARHRQSVAGAVVNDRRIHPASRLVDRRGDAVERVIGAVDIDIGDRAAAHLNLQRARADRRVGRRGEIAGVDALRLRQHDIAQRIRAQRRVGAGRTRHRAGVAQADRAIVQTGDVLQPRHGRLQAGQAALHRTPGAQCGLVRLFLVLQQRDGLLIRRRQRGDQRLHVDAADQT